VDSERWARVLDGIGDGESLGEEGGEGKQGTNPTKTRELGFVLPYSLALAMFKK
jgi:hypothetical protein